ncbi:hypothetical protein LDO32_11410 [Luteimonas sp. Y-2-2-4F]|nr:hypothetical protein [Luteimonas sp. Y-2-2-4F]MCD9032333.1 hypothetical protein [Luteimonas sp. Y-2-2-4F]
MASSTGTAGRTRSGHPVAAWGPAAALLLAACAGGVPGHRNTPVDGVPHLPRDAREVAQRLAACVHLSGEFGGDGSERDREVAGEMTRLCCETVEADVAAVRLRYAGNPEVLEALSGG